MTLPEERREMALTEHLAVRQTDFVVWDAVDGSEVDEALAERASIHDEQAVVLREAVHEDGLHRRRAGRGQVDRPRRIGRMHELPQQAVGVEHQLGEFRRAEIRHLLSPELLENGREHLDRAYGKEFHLISSQSAHDRSAITSVPR